MDTPEEILASIESRHGEIETALGELRRLIAVK
jgi:hypothetical protein